MKKFIICLFIVSSLTAKAQENLIDGVVWIVGENAILKSEIEEQRLRAQYEGVQFQGDAYCFIPEQMAVQKLFLHQATLDSIYANDGQVEMQVNMQINDWISRIGSKEKLEEYYTKPLNEIKEELRTSIRDQSIVQQVQQKLIGEHKTTPSEVRKFYNTLSQDSIPTVPATVEVQILKLEPAVSDADKEATKERLRELADRVNSGNADFAMLARLYSEDDGTTKNGGDLGFFGRGVMEPEFSNAAFALTEQGKVSRVIETQYGFHIIQLVEKRGDRIQCRHILMRPKVNADVKTLTLNRLDSISDAIKKQKLSFEQAVALFSSDKDTRMSGGLMSNQNNGASKFEYQDLPPEISKKVYDMNVGEISEPFSMLDQKLGHEVFVIVKVKSKLPNHKANLTDDYQDIKHYCESVKSNETIDNWVKSKIKDTYVYILPEWRNCKFKYEGWVK
ncbi:MAG: peptidylprolyl isomerase [Prevotellaceae bacterium]|jgi:peptidyl-prolyl cis-trans isomerase SurA|nr:peptidylprolyl isomerase [Prevotellaceae bacterium]